MANGKTPVFRHALAPDEYRVKFRQEVWHSSLPEKILIFSIQDWTGRTGNTWKAIFLTQANAI